MALYFYIGLLEGVRSSKRFVVFRSSRIPTKKTYPYFKKVLGPFTTQRQVDDGLSMLKSAYGYKENPVKCRCGGGCTGRKSNPGERWHIKHFEKFMKQADMHRLGEPAYLTALAKAYAHLESAGESAKQGIS